MMKIIVDENLISFKVLKQKIDTMKLSDDTRWLLRVLVDSYEWEKEIGLPM